MTTTKVTIAAAIVAAVSISAYLGFRPATESELSELQLANAEALSDGEVYIEYHVACDGPGDGCVLSGTRYYPTYKGIWKDGSYGMD